MKLISTIVVLMIAKSCVTGCPPDREIGEVNLTSVSQSFFPFEGSPTIVFKDTAGNELEFRSNEGVLTEDSQIAVYKICTEVKFDGQSTYEHFRGQTKYIVFFSSNPNFAYNLGIFTENLRPEEETFYDKLIVDINGTGTIGRGEIITDVQFSGAYQDNEFGIDSPMEFLAEVTLNGVSYQNVYQSEDFDGRQIYYTKEQGVVGFKDGTTVYNLDRIVL
jgi:hypothetical protein